MRSEPITKPKALQTWINERYPDDYREKGYPAGLRQAMFVRDECARVTCIGIDYETTREKGVVWVIGEHTSKSVHLPVYSIEPPGKGIRFVLRNNWYNWKVSVLSDRPIEIDSFFLFDADPPEYPDYEGDDLSTCYFEGFPETLIFGYYNMSDKKTFSLQMSTDEQLWTFLFLTMRSYERGLWEERAQAAKAKTREGALKSRKSRTEDDIAKLEFQLEQKRKEAAALRDGT